MKFLFDAHLPPMLCRIFQEHGHESLTTQSLLCGNASTDQQIIAFCKAHNWIMVTKDKDFYFSHILTQTPQKLLLVRCGNLRLHDLLTLFEQHIGRIAEAFQKWDLVELFPDKVVVAERTR